MEDWEFQHSINGGYKPRNTTEEPRAGDLGFEATSMRGSNHEHT